MTRTSTQRKKQSERILQQEGVPYLSTLAPLEESAIQHNTETIAIRAMCLCLIASLASGMPHEQFTRLSEQYHLDDAYSPQELAFIAQDQSMSDTIETALTWRYESYWVLLWVLGYLTELERPDHPCDVEQAIFVMRARMAEEFIQQAQLRPIDEILDAADLTFRYHWAVQDAINQEEPAPSGLMPGVVFQRQRTFSWLLKPDYAWDTDSD